MEANNYQPPTRNPQQEVSGGLQPDSPNLQPLENENGSQFNPNALPKTDNLQVKDNNTSSGTIQVGQSSNSVLPPANGTSLWVFSVVSLILAIILLAMAKIAKPADQVMSAPGDKKDIKQSTVEKDKIIASKSDPVKPKPKKKNKKNTKKKKKK